MFFSKTVFSRVTLLPLILLLAAGCDSQDGNPAGLGGTGTGGTGDGDGITDAETFQQQAVMAFESAHGVASGVDDIARGDFSQFVTNLGLPTSPARADEFVWNEIEDAWILSDQGTESDATGTASWTIWAWIQFRDASGTPQMEPDESTAALTIDLDWDIYAEAQEDGEVFLMDFAYSDDLEVSGLPDGPYPVDGSGTMAGRLMWSFGDDLIDVSFDMGWAMDLLVPANDGCPTGTMSVSVDQFEATATYNGTPTYSWVVKENGAVVETGSEPLACDGIPAGTKPVRVWDRWSALRP